MMVDDLVRSGGTLIECHAVLAANGAKHGTLLKVNILHFRYFSKCIRDSFRVS